MSRNLNQAVAANGFFSGVQPRASANQRSKSLTVALLATAGLVFACGSGLAYFLSTEIAHVQSKVANLQAQAGSSMQITRRYQTTQLAYNDTSEKLSFLETSAAANQYVPTLLQQLQTLAQTTGLVVSSVKPGPLASSLVKPKATPSMTPPSAGASTPPVLSSGAAKPVAAPPYDTQPITVSVNGTYSQIMSFIYALPHFPKILCLKSLSFSPKGGNQTEGNKALMNPQLTASLTIDAYVFSPPPTLPGQVK